MEHIPQNFKDKGVIDWKTINYNSPKAIECFWKWMNSAENFEDSYSEEDIKSLKEALDLGDDVDISIDTMFSLNEFIDVNNEAVFGLDYRELYDFFDENDIFIYIYRDVVGRWSYAIDYNSDLYKSKMFFEDREHSETKAFSHAFEYLEKIVK